MYKLSGQPTGYDKKLQDAVMRRSSLVVHIISSTASSMCPQHAAPSLVGPSHAG
jgi:hypothetical protein